METDEEPGPRAFAETSFSLQKLAASLVEAPSPVPAREAVRPTPSLLPPAAVAPFPSFAPAEHQSAPAAESAERPEESAAVTSPSLSAAPETRLNPVAETGASPFLVARPAASPFLGGPEQPPALFTAAETLPPHLDGPEAISRPVLVESPFLDSPAFHPPAALPLPHSLFLPFAIPPASASAPAASVSAVPVESAPGLIVGGAFLVLAGTALASVITLRGMEVLHPHQAADVSSRWARQGTEFFLITLAAGMVACLGLGIGSAAMRRWAPPLIHAAAWVAVLFTLFLLSGVTIAVFHADETAAPPAGWLAWCAAAGLAAPLALIAYYQRDGVASVCAAMDPRGRAVPPSAVPARMVIVAALLLGVLSAAMLRHQPAFPWFGEIRAGENASVAWVSCSAFFAFTALLAAARSAVGWWLLLAGTLALGADAVITFRTLPFADFLSKLGRPADPLPPLPGPAEAWIVLPFLPLLLILLMSRRAFGDSPSGHPSLPPT